MQVNTKTNHFITKYTYRHKNKEAYYEIIISFDLFIDQKDALI